MLRFSIYAPDSIVVVDNAITVVSLAALPANVVVVAFQIDHGSIEYNDRPNLRTPFTDPSPYQPFINLWTTAAAAQTPALQLTQAKQVKVDLVEAIFHHKRRLPYSYGGRVYEATDEAVASMTAAMVSGTSGDTGGLVGSVNSALATLTGQINGTVVGGVNTVVGGVNAMVTANNGSAAAVNSWSGAMASNWNIVLRGGDNIWRSTSDPNTNPGSGGFANMSSVGTIGSIAGASVAAGGGSITWQPIGQPDPISLPGSELSGALGSIVARRNALYNNRVDKQAAINALSTIPDVTAYDATTGWSF